MNKIIWHTTMSLDGYIAGPDHAMDWAFRYPKAARPSTLAEDVRDSTGAILGGRGWYDAAYEKYDGVDGIYGGNWQGPVFVLTSHPEDAPDDPKVTFLSDGLEAAVATAREAAGPEKNLEIFGANLAQQCLANDLLDEIAVHIAPVLLGDGIRLYGPGHPQRELDGPVTDVRFAVA